MDKRNEAQEVSVQAPQENKMGVMSVGKLVFTMSLPIILSMLVQALYNVVDSVFVSMISPEAFNAVSLAFPAQNLMIGFATGSAVGVNALVSRALGAKDPKHANRVAMNGIFIALCCYMLFLFFALFGARPFFSIVTKADIVIEYGCDYLLVVCGLSFGIFCEVMFERLLTSTGRTVYTMISQGVGAVFNIIFDPIFIFVFKLGVTGAALATVFGQMVACGLAIFFNIRKNPELKLHISGFRPDLGIIKSISSIGVPSIIMVAVGSIMTYLFNIILLNYTTGGIYTQNVFGAYFKLNSLIFMPIFGLNNGVVPIIAYNYGARKKRRMMQTIRISMLTAVSLMALGTLIFMLFPDKLLRIFIQNATAEELTTMLEIGVPAMRIICTHFVIAAVVISFNNIFQALGRSIYASITAVIRQLVVLIPVAYLLARLGMRVGNDNLVWFSFPIAELSALIVGLICFRKVYRDIISKLEDEPQPITAPA